MKHLEKEIKIQSFKIYKNIVLKLYNYLIEIIINLSKYI